MHYLVMLASAFGLGAAHALEPGHGKTVVAAYLVGSRGRAIDAVILGAVVTFTHTFSVILLAVASTAAAAYLVPEQVQRTLAIGSGLLVTAVGLVMIYLRTRKRPARLASDHHHPHGHDHSHDSARDHGHHHQVPAGDGSRVGLGSLLALGVSGGIVPCPAALALIPAVIGLGAAVKGLTLILSFSLGLALVLMAVGIMTLKAAGFAATWLDRGDWARRVGLASAYLITALGLALTARAFLVPPEMH